MGFSATLSRNGRTALITLEGELDALHADDFRNRVEQAANGGQIDQLVLDMTDLTYMSSAGMRGLVFARQKMGEDIRIVLVRASDSVEQTIRLVSGVTDADLTRIVDEAWDPPVTLGVRLVSVISDGLQHAGQAAFIRGILLRER